VKKNCFLTFVVTLFIFQIDLMNSHSPENEICCPMNLVCMEIHSVHAVQPVLMVDRLTH